MCPGREHPAFATWNRGKRSIVLDLKSSEGQARAQELARTADVLIENFRPGVSDRLGVGYARLSQVNPDLVYCSLPGFGEKSPHRHKRGWDPVVGAAAGLYRRAEGTSGEPLFLPLPAASTFGAFTGAVAVTTALIARRRGCGGQRIEIPLFSSLFTTIGIHLVKMHDSEYVNYFPFGRQVMARQYQCADGRWVQNQGMYKHFTYRFMEAAGHPEWIEEVEPLLGKDLDPAAADRWVGRFREAFRQRTAQEWEDAISATGGACAICRSIDEWMAHPHATAAGMVVEVEDATLGSMKQPGIPVRLRGTPGAIQGRAPLEGEHTREVLEEMPTREGPRQARPPGQQTDLESALQGVRVLDLCIVLAGPTCGRTLAEFGADVIKIDDPRRPYDPLGSIDVNRGKRSILIDLKTEVGREVFWRLVETADVVLENYRKGSLARLGLGFEDVRKRKPDIVYASVNSYGYDGPWSGRPGWEQLAQATSGIQVRRGGRDGAPLTLPFPMNDYGTGLLGAFAVALALHERHRSGLGQSVDCGLTLTACLLQSPYFLDFPGFERREPEGRDVRGYSALSRLYAASDGWFYLHCPSEGGWSGLTGLPNFTSLAADRRFATGADRQAHDAELAAELDPIFARRAVEEWTALLEPLGVSVMRNGSYRDLGRDPAIHRAELIVSRDHPGLGRVDHVGNTARLSRTPMRLGRPSQVPGAETEAILREVGYSQREIEALEAAGAVSRTKE